MMPNEETNGQESASRSGEEILGELDQIDQHLQGGLGEDTRLQNGVPDTQRHEDLDFIQMSGLANPSAEDESGEEDQPDTDTSRPLNFFEKGVADVDSTMVPGTLEDAGEADQVIVTETADETSPEALRAMLASMDDAQEGAEKEDAVDAVTLEESIAADLSLPDEEPTPPEEPSLPEPASLDEPVDSGLEPAPPALANADLLEAERLVQELQAQPREEPADVAMEEPPEDLPHEVLAPEPAVSPDLEAEAAVYQRARTARSGRRRGSGPHRTSHRRVFHYALVILVLVAAGWGTYEATQWAKARWAAPTDTYNRAKELAAEGQYRRASQAYASFAAMYSSHPLRPEAQFQAAYVLQLTEGGSPEETARNYQDATEGFEAFINDNPTYSEAKLARAQYLTGRLYYKLNRYQEAIDCLSDPELRLKDPGAALPITRILAASHAELGNYQAARDLYLEAAKTPVNHTPDEDYSALAKLYEGLADRAASEAERRTYQKLALEQWRNAGLVPGANRISKQKFRSKIDVLTEQLAADPTTASAAETALGGSQ